MQYGIQGTDVEIQSAPISTLTDTNLQASFWTFAFLFHDLTEEPRHLLGAASVNGESETSVAVVVYHLNESHHTLEVE